MIRFYIYEIISWVVNVLDWLIIIRVILSWIAPYSRNGFTDLIYSITEPILRPLRTILPISNLRVDLSPILAYFLLYLIQRISAYLLFAF